MSDGRIAWWENYGSLLKKRYKNLIADESQASSILWFQNSIIPGLLQTESYARAAESLNWPAIPTPQETAAWVEVRMRRQWEVLGRPNSPMLSVVLDESALYRQLGGADVQREQLIHLLKVIESPNIQLSILPITTGGIWYVYGVSAFTMLALPARHDEFVLYVDCAPLYTERFDDAITTDLYLNAFTKLQIAAEKPDETATYITKALRTLDKLHDVKR